jgi:hypothetical protein
VGSVPGEAGGVGGVRAAVVVVVAGGVREVVVVVAGGVREVVVVVVVVDVVAIAVVSK